MRYKKIALPLYGVRVIFLMRARPSAPLGPVTPEGVSEQQDGDDIEHMAQSEDGDEMAAKEGAGEHADELEGLIEAVDAAHAGGRSKLSDEVVDGGHEARDGNAVNEAQQGELPRCGHEALRDGGKACEQQAGWQDAVRPDPVGKVSKTRGKEHARKARTREHSA